MKIAMIGHKRIPSREGGIEIVVDKLSTQLVRNNHRVVAYNRKGHHVSGKNFKTGCSSNEYNGIKLKNVFTFENSALNAAVYSFFASVRASLGKFDVVHYHAEGPAAMCFLPKLFGKKVIVTIHGLDWKRSKWGGFAARFLKFGEKNAVKYADEIIVLSKNIQKYFYEEYNRKTVYIPNGISKPQLKDCNEIKKAFGIEKDKYILYLGRIVPEKGIHYLINAYKNIDTDFKLVIAGGSSHTNDYMKSLKSLAGNDKRIIFTDFVQGEVLEELYSNAYIYCLPSDLEGMPISLLEAMSYGNCCLTSDIPECTEVCGDKAVYFEHSNEKELKTKLEELINNKNTVLKYKQSASEYVCSKYNWQDICIKTVELYRGK